VKVMASTVTPGCDRDIYTTRLVITIAAEPCAPTPAHELLVAFRFSAGPAQESRQQVVMPGPELLVGEDRYECWWYKGGVARRTVDDIRVAECDDYTFVVLQRDDVPTDRFREHAYTAYRDLLNTVDTTAHGYLVRIWNYFPSINLGNGDSEKYRQFSIGRAEAFEEAGIIDGIIPAGTAVGTSDSSLTIIALLSKHDFRPTENPRQVSAYNYPRQYGPRSPKFSRGTCIATQDQHLFLISGTAAIVGHESRYPYRTDLQLEETLENLNCLIGQASGEVGDERESGLDSKNMLRVYLRDPEELDEVADRLLECLGGIEDNVVFLQADICRRELMIEIDGVRCF